MASASDRLVDQLADKIGDLSVDHDPEHRTETADDGSASCSNSEAVILLIAERGIEMIPQRRFPVSGRRFTR